jgi:hypothetical protein
MNVENNEKKTIWGQGSIQMSTLRSTIGRFFILILMGFSGGFLAIMFCSWSKPLWLKETMAAADGLALANTYIVFTSFIFVAFTVFLGVAGFLFTQQFSQSKETHVNEAIEHIKNTISGNGVWSTSLMNAILENPDVKRHVQMQLDKKVEELIDQRFAALSARAQAAAELKGASGSSWPPPAPSAPKDDK